MFSKAKYVVGVVKTSYSLGLSAVCVDEGVNHKDLACLFVEDTIRSAGFFHTTADSVVCYGESTSLGLKTHPEDEDLVGRSIGHSRYVAYF